MEHVNWTGFTSGVWQNEINVRDFIQTNYKPYEGDDSFLAAATPRTEALMKKIQGLFALERQFGGVLDIDTATVIGGCVSSQKTIFDFYVTIIHSQTTTVIGGFV